MRAGAAGGRLLDCFAGMGPHASWAVRSFRRSGRNPVPLLVQGLAQQPGRSGARLVPRRLARPPIQPPSRALAVMHQV